MGKTEAKTDAVIPSDPSLPKGDIQLSTDNEKGLDIILDPLFDDETAPTVEELKEGGVSEKKDESVSSPSADEKKSEEKEVEAKAKEDEKAEAEKKAEEEKAEKEKGEKAKPKDWIDYKGEKPPSGYVPYPALRDKRDEVDMLKARISELEATKVEPKKEPEIEGKKEALTALADRLKTLTDLKENATEDPVGTIQQTIDAVVNSLNEIQSSIQKGDEKRAETDRQTEEQRTYENVVSEGFKKMESFVPGLFDTEKDVNKTLSKFANDNGISNGLLKSITHPGTTILGPDGKAHYLGEDAAFFTLFLNNAYGFSQANSDDALKEARKEIEKEVTKEILKKIKSGHTDFKSLGDLPGSTGEDAGEIFSADTLLSETEFAKLSAAGREKYLSM